MDDKEKFEAYLREMGISLVCPVCGYPVWGLERSTIPYKSRYYPQLEMLLVICERCYHVRWFLASTIDEPKPPRSG